jgi:molecular chaperone DnaK
MGEKVSADQRSKVESKVKDLREAIQGDDRSRIQKAIDALQSDLQAIGQAAYQQQPGTSGQPGTQGGGPSGETGGDDEDVVEGEYREA